MPDQNPADPTAPNPVTPFGDMGNAAEPPPPAMDSSDLPPAPPIVEAAPEVPPVGDTGGATPTFDISNSISGTPPPKKKFGGRRFVATILGLLVLVGGLGAGIILVQQQQDIRERAAADPGGGGGGTIAPTPTATRVPTPRSTSTPTLTPSPTATSVPSGLCPRDCIAPKSRCAPNSFYPTESQSLGYGDCGAAAGEYCCNAGTASTPIPTPTGTSGGTCTLTGAESCVGNNPTGDCYQGGQGNQYACYKLKGNPGKKISGSTSCTCPAPYTWGPRQEYGSWWCFNTAITNCTPSADTSEMCSLQPQQCSSSPPPGTGPTAQCLNIKAFDTSWNLLSTTQMQQLKSGDSIRFTVAGTATSGTFDKAKFKINGIERPEVTGKRPGSEEFFDEYTIPVGVTTFTINAQIHHTTLGYSN